MSRCEFYVHDGGDEPPEPCALPEGYQARLWRPSDGGVTPAGVSWSPFAAWWLFHRLGLFANRDYALLLIERDGRLVHRSSVFPGWFRFPFMGPDDLQIGDTWTEPSERGKGLATAALRAVLEQCGRPGRRFWYVAEAENLPSIRAAEKARFRRAGDGVRTKRFGTSALGAFVLERPSPPDPACRLVAGP